jgi:hypothetical protein
VRNLADQNAAVQAAYYGFLDRFRHLPGDMDGTIACTLIGNNLTGCGGAAAGGPGGNDDGIIGSAGRELNEAAAVWAHLSAAGFIAGGYAGTTATTATYRTAEPAVAPPNAFNGRLVLAHTAAYQATAATQRLNLTLGHNIPASIARELDTKLDDGIPLTGILHAAAGPGGGGALADLVEVGGAACLGAGTATGTSVWDAANDFSDCNAVILY